MLFSTVSSGSSAHGRIPGYARIYLDQSVLKGDAMSFIQIACAVLVPLLWGYQFVAIKVGVLEFPPLFFLGLRFLAIALLLIPFVKRPTRHQFGPVAAISVFLGGLNFGLFYVGLGLGSGSMSPSHFNSPRPSPSC
jgi:O-acetylserine/cysteine efflux transporter